MEQIIQAAMTKDIQKEAANLYGFDVDTLIDQGGFENFVYQFKKDDSFFIVRFVHSRHRSYEDVLAEIEFIDYLDKHRANVSTIILSNNQELCLKIKCANGHYFTVSVFTKAKGKLVRHKEVTSDMWYSLGKDVGKLHRLTKTYQPVHKRKHWYEEAYIEQSKDYLPQEDQIIIEKAKQIRAKVKALEISKDTYGLIHTDLHFGNMFFDGNDFTFFDFDDASYKYFMSDIAIIVYYYFVFSPIKEKKRLELSKRLITNLLRGYLTENDINPELLSDLNDFFKLRETILYLVLMADSFQKDLNDARKKFIQKLRHNIINDIPFYEDLSWLEPIKKELF